jgi:hypothetical protein
VLAVPKTDAPYVLGLCAELAPGAVPTLIDLRSDEHAAERDCFSIVSAKIAAYGGTTVCGWALWEWPGVFVEAEFHAVWQPPTGELLDLTPRPVPFGRTLFLPDRSRLYEGRQVDNRRRPLVRDSDVTRYLYLFSRQFEILNAGDLAFQHGPITLPPRAEREYISLQKEGAALERRLKRRYGPQE